MSAKGNYLSFEGAREFVKKLGFKSREEFQKWSKSGDRPSNIPGNPNRTYKTEWKSWGDFLGTGNVRTKEFVSFEEAREFVQRFGFKSYQEFQKWSKSGDRPSYIPSAPNATYKTEWKGCGDFLGTGNVYTKEFLSYEEAKEFVKKRGFKGQVEFKEWSKYGDRPNNIPGSPNSVYKSAWRGWSDWLGVVNLWKTNELTNFLTDDFPALQHLHLSELVTTLNDLDPNPLPSLQRALGTNTWGETLKALKGQDVKTLVAKVQQSKELDADYAEAELMPAREREIEAILSEDDDDDAQLTAQDLHSVDEYATSKYANESTIAYLVNNRVHKLWCVYAAQGKKEALSLLKGSDGKWFKEIKRVFTEQTKQVENLQLPKGYKFEHKPNIMQKHTAWKFTQTDRHGNWSGVGAGKTLSGLLATRTVDAKLTLVVAANSTVAGWEQAVKDAFPGHVDKYMVINYEKFQQKGSNKLVESLLQLNPDFVIFDEIQMVKVRQSQQQSIRRDRLEGLLKKLSASNPDLHVLGMSATPVINDLHEAKKLLEMITGKELDLATENKITNGIHMHKALWQHGFRYRPQYDKDIEPRYIETNGSDKLLAEYRNSGKVLDLEAALVPLKMKSLAFEIKKGTILYTEYVGGGIQEAITKAVKKLGLTVGYYTGKDKSGFEPFLAGKVDVLIASKAIGVGTDGLQKVSNKIILITLPWTGAQFEQVVGRIRRQGSAFENVNVVVPQIVFASLDEHSWDKARMAKVKTKRTMSRFVLDGEQIPEVFGEISGETFRKKLLKTLEDSLNANAA